TSWSIYALSNAGPESVLRWLTFSSPPFFKLWAVGLSSGLSFSLAARSVADLLTPVWSVTIIFPNAWTSLLVDLDSASLPASMSTWFAVTTIAAICASVGPLVWAAAVNAAKTRTLAHREYWCLIVYSLRNGVLSFGTSG